MSLINNALTDKFSRWQHPDLVLGAFFFGTKLLNHFSRDGDQLIAGTATREFKHFVFSP